MAARSPSKTGSGACLQKHGSLSRTWDGVGGEPDSQWHSHGQLVPDSFIFMMRITSEIDSWRFADSTTSIVSSGRSRLFSFVFNGTDPAFRESDVNFADGALRWLPLVLKSVDCCSIGMSPQVDKVAVELGAPTVGIMEGGMYALWRRSVGLVVGRVEISTDDIDESTDATKNEYNVGEKEIKWLRWGHWDVTMCGVVVPRHHNSNTLN